MYLINVWFCKGFFGEFVFYKYVCWGLKLVSNELYKKKIMLKNMLYLCKNVFY